MRRLAAALAAVAALCASPASAQFFDFDALCASPPCGIGTLLSPWGVTTAPTTPWIVAGGTSGLVGPSGAKVLLVSSFPYDVTFTLNRNAQFAAFQVARSSAAGGPVTLQVTALRGGVMAGVQQNVTLSTVGAWVSVRLSDAVGFDSVVIDAIGTGTLTYGLDGLQFGGRCSGFADVATTDVFCNATEWLANRGVTLGCANGLYCPTGPVTRAQMALFMQRLGNAIATKILTTTCAADGAYGGLGVIACRVAIPADTRLRTATAMSHCAHVEFDAAKVIRQTVAYSHDDFATYITQRPAYATGFAAWMLSTASVHTRTLSAGLAHAFAVHLVHESGTAAEEIASDCRLTVIVADLVAPDAPYDLPDGAP